VRFALLAVLCGCTPVCGEAPALTAPDAAPRPTTRPPRRDVRVYPPHAIRADGIGPYRIGAPLIDVLHTLPEGPRLSIVQVGDYANWQLVRAEAGQLQLGIRADTRTVGFIAVLAQPIAHTAEGLGVGSTGEELTRALGKPRDESHRARDRWSFVFDKQPGVRFLTDARLDEPPATARTVAVLVSEPEEKQSAEPSACHDVTRIPLDEVAALVSQAADAPPPRLRFGCVTSKEPEVLAWAGGQLHVLGGEPGKLRRLAAVPSAEPALLAALDVDEDGRDEVVVGVRENDGHTLRMRFQVWRWGQGGLESVLETTPFAITEAMALAVGSPLAQVDLVVDAWAKGGELWVSGLYLARTSPDGPVRDVVPLQADHFAITRRTVTPPPAPAPAAPPPDAAVDRGIPQPEEP
jgi:hypothetical protein